MQRYILFVLRHRLLVAGLFVLLTGVMAYPFGRIRFSSGLDLLLGESPHYPRYLDLNRQFGADGLAVVGIPTDRPLDPALLSGLERAIAPMKEDPFTKEVHSVLTAQRLSGENDTLNVEYYAAAARADPSRQAALTRELAADPLHRGLLVSGDGRHTAVALEATADERPAEDTLRTVDLMRDAFRTAGMDPDGLFWSGNIVILAENLVQAYYNLNTITPMALLIVAAAIYLMFRRMWPVLLTLLITGLAITWTLGLAMWIYGELNYFVTMIPPMILVTTFADVVHLSSAYITEAENHPSQHEAILHTGAEVGKACLFTSMTAFFGFVSLALTPAPVMRQGGLLMGFGVAVALFMATTLLPILFSLFRPPKPWSRPQDAARVSRMDRVLFRCASLSLDHPKAVNRLFCGLLALSLIGCAVLRFETSFVNRLQPDNRVQIGANYFNEKFEGAQTLDIYLSTAREGGLLDPAVFAGIAALQDEIGARPDIRRTLSLVDLVRRLNGLINPELEDPNALPPTREGLAQLLLLFEMSGGRRLESLIDAERSTMKMTLRIPTDEVRRAYRTGQEIAALARARLGPGVEVEPQGYIYLLGEWLDDMLRGQRNGLLFAFMTIALSMSLVVRSVRMGFYAMLPNAFPLLAVGGWAGFMWDKLDSDALIAGDIAIGIAVDDTIHFLSRLRHEMGKSDDLRVVLERTYRYCGRAMLISSGILVAAFLPYATSDFFSFRILGTLLPVCMLVALGTEILWVPALVRLGVFRLTPDRHGREAAPVV